jgi:hypothetical protein
MNLDLAAAVEWIQTLLASGLVGALVVEFLLRPLLARWRSPR